MTDTNDERPLVFGEVLFDHFPDGGVVLGGAPFNVAAHLQAYDHIDASQLPPVSGFSLLYHGSLALRGVASRRALDQLHARSGAPQFMDVNLRAPWWDEDRVRTRIEAARWSKLNDSELRTLERAGVGLETKARALQDDWRAT